MRTRVSLPRQLEASAAAYWDGQLPAVAARDASTVVLLRDSDAGLQVYLMRRQTSMAFAAGMYVFPGGGVDARDRDETIAWAGPSPEQWGHRLGVGEASARELVAAAVRETFEESGVLLAGDSPTTVVADVSGDDWDTDRAALESRRLSFAALLKRRGLALRTDLLAAWTHWSTPEFEPRRYDTRFFVAALPVGQRTRDIYGEADRVTWMSPQEAVAAVDSGAIAMLPPTYVTCAELAGFDSSAAVLAAAVDRPIQRILPRLVRDGDAFLLETDLP
jgi:8-oxo-dGTP pyrophosphatase MutT (NUDIX family)